MHENDLAYAAGFFDAEGSVSIGKWKQKSMIAPRYSLCVGLVSANKLVLNWFKDSFGGSVYRHSKKDECFHWSTQANIAANFLRKIIPYLRIKKFQTKLALQFQKEIRKNNKFRRITEEALRYREQLRNRISFLNYYHCGVELTNKCQIAYIAGLFDGDGSICIAIWIQKNPRFSPVYYLKIDIGSVEESIISWLKENLGGHSCFNKVCFIWEIKRKGAEKILQRILPYLRIKNSQAELALQFQEEENKRRSQGKRLTAEILERREKFRQEMKALNHNS